MSNPEYQVCPVCSGTGVVSRPPGVPADQATWAGTNAGPWPCPKCNGERVILKPAMHFMGTVPVYLDPDMPPDTFRIGDYLIHVDPGAPGGDFSSKWLVAHGGPWWKPRRNYSILQKMLDET